MVVNLLAIGLNLLLNYLLIHGAGSMPGLGFVGSPLATGAPTSHSPHALLADNDCYVPPTVISTWVQLLV
jgi:hypothetical protein